MTNDIPLIPDTVLRPEDAAAPLPSSMRPDSSYKFEPTSGAQVSQSQGILATAITKTRSPIAGRR